MNSMHVALAFHGYNPFLVYCRELALGTIKFNRWPGPDSKHDSHYSINTLLASAVLTNSKFGLFYSNFLILTPTFSKMTIEKIGKTLNFSSKQQFYFYFQNPSENSGSGEFCRLLMIFAVWTYIRPARTLGQILMRSKLFDTERIIWKSEFWKMSAEHKKTWKK